MMENEERASSQVPSATKLCPFCAERIQVLAIKCRYCGEFLNRPPVPSSPKPAGKWYFSMSAMVVALLTLGPLALPAVWINPRLTVTVKAVITVATILVTILLCWAMARMYANLMQQVESLGL